MALASVGSLQSLRTVPGGSPGSPKGDFDKSTMCYFACWCSWCILETIIGFFWVGRLWESIWQITRLADAWAKGTHVRICFWRAWFPITTQTVLLMIVPLGVTARVPRTRRRGSSDVTCALSNPYIFHLAQAVLLALFESVSLQTQIHRCLWWNRGRRARQEGQVDSNNFERYIQTLVVTMYVRGRIGHWADA